MDFSRAMIFMVAAMSMASAHATLYRWVDDNGDVHYGDKVPEQYLKKQHEELNEQGALVKKHDRALTAEEKAEKKRQEAKRERLENERRQQALRDRVLTDTYTTERDLMAARDARLDAIDSQLQLSKDIIESSTVKVKKTEEFIQKLKAANRMVPEATYAKLEREKAQLLTQKGVQEGHQKKREEVIKQFDGYIQRFRELMAEKQKRREAYVRRKAERARAASDLPPTSSK